MADKLFDPEGRGGMPGFGFEKNKSLSRDLRSYARMERWDEGEPEERARLQQEGGTNIFPEIIKLIKSGDIDQYQAVALAEGVDAPDREMYNFFKGVALMSQVNTGVDKSALDRSLKAMAGFSSSRGQFDADSKRIIDKITIDGDADDLRHASHILDGIVHDFDHSRRNYREDSRSTRDESRSTYEQERRSFRNPFATPSFLNKPERKSPFEAEDETNALAELAKLMHDIKIHEIKADSPDWIIFKDADERQEVVEIGRDIARYMHDRGLNDVIFVDRAARPAYLSVKENWRRMYPNDKMPNIYFMNPKGFKSKESLNADRQTTILNMLASILKGEELENPDDARTEDEISEDVKVTYSRLFSEPNKHVLLYDNCIHTGNSVRPIVDQLTSLGLDVRLGISSDNRNDSGLMADLVCMDKVPEGVCYPFDKDEMVSKTYSSVKSRKTHDEEKVLYARRIRKEIKRAVEQYYS